MSQSLLICKNHTVCSVSWHKKNVPDAAGWVSPHAPVRGAQLSASFLKKASFSRRRSQSWRALPGLPLPPAGAFPPGGASSRFPVCLLSMPLRHLPTSGPFSAQPPAEGARSSLCRWRGLPSAQTPEGPCVGRAPVPRTQHPAPRPGVGRAWARPCRHTFFFTVPHLKLFLLLKTHI